MPEQKSVIMGSGWIGALTSFLVKNKAVWHTRRAAAGRAHPFYKIISGIRHQGKQGVQGEASLNG